MKVARAIAGLVGISALAAASRSILSEDRRSVTGFVRGLILACFVGGIVGLLIQHQDLSPSLQGAFVGISGFVADDILLFVINFSRKMRDDPTAVVDMMIDWIVKLRSKP